jgi:hypothetical protein
MPYKGVGKNERFEEHHFFVINAEGLKNGQGTTISHRRRMDVLGTNSVVILRVHSRFAPVYFFSFVHILCSRRGTRLPLVKIEIHALGNEDQRAASLAYIQCCKMGSKYCILQLGRGMYKYWRFARLLAWGAVGF